MNYTTDLLQQLRRDWDRCGHDAASQATFRAFTLRHPALALSGDAMADVLDRMESRSGASVIEKAAIMQALLEDATDAFVRRAMLQTLLPGIVATCRELRFGSGIIDDPSETLGVAIALCAELLVDWAGQSRPYAGPDLLSALRGRLRRWLLKEKAAQRHVAPEPIDVASPPGSALLTRLEQLRGGPFDRLVRLTYARVFEGVSLQDLAKADCSSTRRLQQELQIFALQQLL